MAHARGRQASPPDGGYFYPELRLRQDPGEFPGVGMRTASFPELLASALPPGIPRSTAQAPPLPAPLCVLLPRVSSSGCHLSVPAGTTAEHLVVTKEPC